MTAMAENREALVQKGLSDWWSEEMEYVFQRIERWAVFARGYNRLRSQRWFKNRQAVKESLSTPSDENLTQFHTFKRFRWKLHPEEIKINCCGTLNYQSNSKLDSNCLETYRYDHSIYFKTIGDIKSDKRDQNQNQDSTSVSSEEQVEWDANLLVDPISNKLSFEETSNILNIGEQEEDKIIQNVWPIVDLSKLNLNLIDNQKEDKWRSRLAGEEKCEKTPLDRMENNVIFFNNIKKDKKNQEDELKEKISKFRTFQRNKRLSSYLQRSQIVDENNVAWPEVFLNYINNIDVANSSSEDQ